MEKGKRIKVLVAKPGLDGHDRGARVVAMSLRDAGMEVIYSGLHQTSEQIIATAIQEDVDVIGLSMLSGAHDVIVPKFMELLKKSKKDNVVVVVGGTIPPIDIPALKSLGLKEIFGPGTPTGKIIEFIKENVA
ncbi:MAG: methylmalonyl-CoA mutase [Nitrospinae bacterium RIFCSPLOWO2_12_FULL_45_22]|nr:MAG: methylmalonyl-CoA mutase [Nitrospinae bacterium RIFCSPLOWO2_12_FULL_45_22]